MNHVVQLPKPTNVISYYDTPFLWQANSLHPSQSWHPETQPCWQQSRCPSVELWPVEGSFHQHLSPEHYYSSVQENTRATHREWELSVKMQPQLNSTLSLRTLCLLVPWVVRIPRGVRLWCT